MAEGGGAVSEQLALAVTAGKTVAGGAVLAIPSYIDKSTWGDGPWQDEPDLLQWCAAEPPHYECQIQRSDIAGCLNGYVALPIGHPMHGKPFEQIPASAHRGLTYAEEGAGGVWVVGFDCARAFDFAPAMESRLSAALGPEHAEWEADLPPFMQNTYKPIGYVREQVESLARQLAAMVPALGEGEP